MICTLKRQSPICLGPELTLVSIETIYGFESVAGAPAFQSRPVNQLLAKRRATDAEVIACLGRRLGRCRRRRSSSSVFFTLVLALLHGLFQLHLVIAEQRMDFTMRRVADSVNLRTQ